MPARVTAWRPARGYRPAGCARGARRSGTEPAGDVEAEPERLGALGASPDLIAALRDQRPVPDDRLAALQEFVLDVVASAGAVSPESLEAFLGQGYTAENALEVVFGIGAYAMSTLANRLVRAPLDDRLVAFAWREPVA